jgi:serine/threonine-protein kinase
MDMERWQELKHLVQECLELPPEERAAYLAAADEELRPEAEALLAVSSTRADALDHVRMVPRPAAEISLREGERIGDYRITRELDRGGMGAVYLAHDTRNERTVALKVLSPQMARLAFDEHRALARLSHQNIATLYDSGTTAAGLRFVVMEYIEGISITAYCEEHRLTTEQRLELFQKVCGAVAYAHQNLVIHRDLKPTNILVTAAGEPKLLDFGIAKLLPFGEADATLTLLGDRPLTVAFASPEQLSGEYTATTSDIYSLGVLLSFLLTGRLPYSIENRYDLPWCIRNSDPIPPSELTAEANGALPIGPTPSETPQKLRRLLRGDLDAIALRALRKEPHRRYRTVDEFADDIDHYLKLEPVLARRGSRRYRMGKFLRRHRQAITAATIAFLLLLAFTVALVWQRAETIRERDNARHEAARAEASAQFLISLFKLPASWNSIGHAVTAHQLLDRALARLDNTPAATPEIRGTLQHSLGKVYLNLGLYTPAESLLAPALGNLEKSRIANSDLIGDVLIDLAEISYHHGLYTDSKRKAEQAAVLKGHPDTKVESLLGHIAFARGDFLQAERLFRSVAASQRREYGPKSLGVLRAQNDLACALHEQGRLAEAEALHDRVLAGRRAIYKDDKAEVLQSLYNLAHALEDQGRRPDAEGIYRAVFSAREAMPIYSMAPTLLLHSLGSLLIDRGELAEASLRLEDSFTLRRRLLPDEHPDIARSLAEHGRLAHARGRSEQAEIAYRQSIARLKGQVGIDHPDTITAEGNLGVLLAETGKTKEALALWRSLAERAAAQPLRPSIRQALTQNLAALARYRPGTGPNPSPYRTLGMPALSLSDFSQPDIPPSVPVVIRPAQKETSVLFADDFNGSDIDHTKWEHGGNVVTEENGELRLMRTVTDSGGWARTRPISVNPKLPLVIHRRAKLHPANQYFNATMSINVVGYPERHFGVSYANYHYTGAGESTTVGFSIFRRDIAAHRYFDRVENASPLIRPLWDQWFDEQLVYDPLTGKVQYSIDGTLRLTYNVDPLPPNASSVTLTFNTWGWYTGHFHYVDTLAVRQ